VGSRGDTTRVGRHLPFVLRLTLGGSRTYSTRPAQAHSVPFVAGDNRHIYHLPTATARSPPQGVDGGDRAIRSKPVRECYALRVATPERAAFSRIRRAVLADSRRGAVSQHRPLPHRTGPGPGESQPPMIRPLAGGDVLARREVSGPLSGLGLVTRRTVRLRVGLPSPG